MQAAPAQVGAASGPRPRVRLMSRRSWTYFCPTCGLLGLLLDSVRTDLCAADGRRFVIHMPYRAAPSWRIYDHAGRLRARLTAAWSASADTTAHADCCAAPSRGSGRPTSGSLLPKLLVRAHLGDDEGWFAAATTDQGRPKPIEASKGTTKMVNGAISNNITAAMIRPTASPVVTR